MIVAEQKSLDEIKTMVADAENVLVVGCGTCVTVCFAGGAREAAITSMSLRPWSERNSRNRFAAAVWPTGCGSCVPF